MLHTAQIQAADDPVVGPLKGSLGSRVQRAKAVQQGGKKPKTWFDFNLVR